MRNISAAIETIRAALPGVVCRFDEPMKNHTSFRIGGPVSAMFFPASEEALTALWRALRGTGLKPLILGNGTNILADDGPIERVVIKTHGGLDEIRLTGETEITAQCGALLSRLAVFAQEHGLTGLEFAHGIPGTLGGAVAMNAGAYGGEIRQAVHRTTVLLEWSAVSDVTGDDHAFSYRRSRFSDTGDIIVSSVLRLRRGVPEEIKARMEELSGKRRESQPLAQPSAGSAFKRPKNGYAAALIEQAGPQGFCRRRRHGVR